MILKIHLNDPHKTTEMIVEILKDCYLQLGAEDGLVLAYGGDFRPDNSDLEEVSGETSVVFILYERDQEEKTFVVYFDAQYQITRQQQIVVCDGCFYNISEKSNSFRWN